MAHENRPGERAVHSKGAGALGYLELLKDMGALCRSSALQQVGQRTPVLARFSVAQHNSDTSRQLRGFAVRFYTEEGNWDLVGHNTPIYFISDPVAFPGLVISQTLQSHTGQPDPNLFWDFVTLRPETMHQVSLLFSDRGIPDGYRHMNGYGSHAFKLINEKGQHVWTKFHFKTEQGVNNLSVERAGELASSDPDYSIRDLYNAIAAGNFPSWSFEMQVMTDEQARQSPFNPFDVTKIWPQKDYPLQQVGRLVLDRIPEDLLSEVEHSAFSPANLPPGVRMSPDKILQGRIFAYRDSHICRLGPDYNNLPINIPHRNPQHISVCPTKLSEECPNDVLDDEDCWQDVLEDEDYTSQLRTFWERVLSEQERSRLVTNMAKNASNCTSPIQMRIVENWSRVSADFGERLQRALGKEHGEDPSVPQDTLAHRPGTTTSSPSTVYVSQTDQV